MVGDGADGGGATGAGARVHALEADAGQCRGAVRVSLTLSSAALAAVVRVALVAGQTEAGTRTIPLAALGVGPAW